MGGIFSRENDVKFRRWVERKYSGSSQCRALVLESHSVYSRSTYGGRPIATNQNAAGTILILANWKSYESSTLNREKTANYTPVQYRTNNLTSVTQNRNHAQTNYQSTSSLQAGSTYNRNYNSTWIATPIYHNTTPLIPQPRYVYDRKYFPSSSKVKLRVSLGTNYSYTVRTLNPWDAEFQDVKRRITNKYFQIDVIEVINAPQLIRGYTLKKVRNRPMEELELFHGTKWAYAHSICTNNFNWRFKGRNVGHRFGQGVNFSSNAMYAANYSKDSGQKVMFIAKVMVGKRCNGKKGMILPDVGCDTSVKQNDDIVLVKYEDNEFYPLYRIRFHISPGYVPLNRCG